MLSLKEYQQRTLDTLKQYFTACSNLRDPGTAFYSLTKTPYSPVKELPGLPYVCLRMPTGGGKTLVASHAVGLAANDFLQVDHALVLWLTPSNAIREQTIKALRDRSHPYRQALDTALQSVTILDIQEALSLRPSICDGSTIIIVATMQAFRVEDTEGRKVYEPSGELKTHFSNLPAAFLPFLETISDGTPIPSLVNVFRLRNPIIIVDEAHNARTDLSFETLARFRPSCIIEFTATPAQKNKPSNVLHAVSAAELNAEEMIKLPIRLESRADWKELLSDALAVRTDLEKTALQEQQLTGEYIRPVMLLQAQPKRKDQETLTVDVVKDCLIEDHKIPEEQIAIATGDTKELADVDIGRPDCQIRFVITVNALREGWDCPFAYVLCSVAELRASTAVEQILGRIMRLPKAKRKKQLKLNQAYAFSASQNFVDAAKALEDALVENGFQRHEAQAFVTPVQYLLEEPVVFMGATSLEISEKPDLKELPKEVAGKVLFDEEKSVITFQGEMQESEKQALVKCFKTTAAKATVEKIYNASRGITVTKALSPAERGEKFSIPVLAIKQGDLFELFEETHFLDFPWKLSAYDPALTEKDFPSERAEGAMGTIDIDEKGAIRVNYLDQVHTQLSFTGLDFAWSAESLILWLDKHIPHPDVVQSDAIGFLNGVLSHLLKNRNFQLENLVRDKYRLKAAIQEKIQQYRQAARAQAYQQLLLPENSTPIEVRPEVCFSFKPGAGEYPYNTVFRGSYNFKKHFYPKVGELNAEGEEFECAVFLDTLPEVKFWVRNLERRQKHSFWLQTSSDRFYPDFVCALEDGRFLVVEYKGSDRWSNDDSQEKRMIGKLWEDRSNGQCLFIMPKGKDLQAIKAKLMKS